MQLMYTENEGEELRPWPTWKGPTVEELNKLNRIRGEYSIQVDYKGIKLHSVIFPDYLRWDAVNGVTGYMGDSFKEWYQKRENNTPKDEEVI